MTQLELRLVYPYYEIMQEYEGEDKHWLMGTFTNRDEAFEHAECMNETASKGYTYAVYIVEPGDDNE